MERPLRDESLFLDSRIFQDKPLTDSPKQTTFSEDSLHVHPASPRSPGSSHAEHVPHPIHAISTPDEERNQQEEDWREWKAWKSWRAWQQLMERKEREGRHVSDADLGPSQTPLRDLMVGIEDLDAAFNQAHTQKTDYPRTTDQGQSHKSASSPVKYVLSGQPTGWSAMAQVVRGFDVEKIDDFKDDIDTLLVFVSKFKISCE